MNFDLTTVFLSLPVPTPPDILLRCGHVPQSNAVEFIRGARDRLERIERYRADYEILSIRNRIQKIASRMFASMEKRIDKSYFMVQRMLSAFPESLLKSADASRLEKLRNGGASKDSKSSQVEHFLDSLPVNIPEVLYQESQSLSLEEAVIHVQRFWDTIVSCERKETESFAFNEMSLAQEEIFLVRSRFMQTVTEIDNILRCRSLIDMLGNGPKNLLCRPV